MDLPNGCRKVHTIKIMGIKHIHSAIALLAIATGSNLHADDASANNTPPKVPAFSVDYMDRSVSPATNFYQFAAGQWLKDNPVPADKSRWASFSELAERNWYLIHEILVDAASHDAALPSGSPTREVGDFFASAMDTNRIEKLGLKPIAADLKRIDRIKSAKDLFAVLADFHQRGIGGLFNASFGQDAKNSSIYAIGLDQGGLSLPDRDYYLKENFAEKLKQYREHLEKMFALLGEKPAVAETNAATVIALETDLAKVSRSRVDLRDPDKNYNKFTGQELDTKTPALLWKVYFADLNLANPAYEIVGQPEFFEALNKLVAERPLSDWKIYLRWHLLHASASLLPMAFEQEKFNFCGKVLGGEPVREPRWTRAAHVIDGTIGEALGQLYVEKNFPPDAKGAYERTGGKLEGGVS